MLDATCSYLTLVLWGRLHKLFCALRQSFGPYAKLLRHKIASQKLGLDVERKWIELYLYDLSHAPYLYEINSCYYLIYWPGIWMAQSSLIVKWSFNKVMVQIPDQY